MNKLKPVKPISSVFFGPDLGGQRTVMLRRKKLKRAETVGTIEPNIGSNKRKLMRLTTLKGDIYWFSPLNYQRAVIRLVKDLYGPPEAKTNETKASKN